MYLAILILGQHLTIVFDFQNKISNESKEELWTKHDSLQVLAEFQWVSQLQLQLPACQPGHANANATDAAGTTTLSDISSAVCFQYPLQI